MIINIYDRANGLLQFSTEADSTDAAWTAFGRELGYEQEEAGLFEKSAYVWSDESHIHDISECRDF